MRWHGQLAVIAMLGGAGLGGWHAYRTGRLADVPLVGSYIGRPGADATADAGARRNQGPVLVDTDTVRTGRIVETHEAVGTTRAFESITVTSKVSGIVQNISFEEGQKANAGDVLLRLDAEERRADMEEAIAETQRAIAQRDEIQRRLERAQTLRHTGAGTQAQVEDLSALWRAAERAVASAEARRRAAEVRLDDLVVRSPFAGRLGTRSVSLGAYISPGTRITSLDDLSRIRLDFSVPENLLAHLKPGQAVHARSAAFGDRIFDGTVSLVDPRVDPVTRTVRLTAEFNNPDEVLKPGMFMSATLEVMARPEATLIPEEAIVNEGLRQLVFVVKDGKVERRVVNIGQRQTGRAEVLDGLSPNETIVVRGLQRVRPGAPVIARPVGAEAPPQAGTMPPKDAAENAPPLRPRSAVPSVGGAAAAELSR